MSSFLILMYTLGAYSAPGFQQIYKSSMFVFWMPRMPVSCPIQSAGQEE